MLHRSLSFALVFVALVLAGCGGGGGNPGVTGGSSDGGGSVAPSLPPLQGTWQLTVVLPNGTSTAAVSVTASEVPTSTSRLDAPAVARLIARTRFQAYTTTLNGSTIRVTDTDTDYVMTITSVSTSGFDGCGTCAVGTDISFTVGVEFTESGTFDGVSIPSRATSTELRVRYLRTA
jgi:hypothetical protein